MSITNNNTGILLISSNQKVGEIIRTGGVIMPSPRVNKDRIDRTMKYVVVCEATSGIAILIGTIAAVMWVDNQCVVRIDSYALINRPDVWQRYGNQFAFAYIKSVGEMKIRPGSLMFTAIKNGAFTNGYTAPEAKAAVASYAAKVEMPTSTSAMPMPIPSTRKTASVGAKPNLTQQEIMDKLAALEEEAATLRAFVDKRAYLHQLVDDLEESELDEVIEYFTQE